MYTLPLQDDIAMVPGMTRSQCTVEWGTFYSILLCQNFQIYFFFSQILSMVHSYNFVFMNLLKLNL